MTELVEAIRAGDRRALARAITLVESKRPEDRDTAIALIDAVVPKRRRSLRIGITGPPGVGKSTFIEALGLYLVELGDKVGVLAVDPSSTRTGGSILGDKTRMEQLAREPLAFIRPSPSSGTLGGVARRTREAMVLLEAWGCDELLVETVGVGQSETDVAAMVDVFVLLLAPASGDELQAVKRGIVELADVVVVNKSDGALVDLAHHTASDYAHALHLVQPHARVLTVSALERRGIEEAFGTIQERAGEMLETGELAARRAAQARDWMWSEVTETLIERVRADANVKDQLEKLEADVAAGHISPSAAARRLLERSSS